MPEHELSSKSQSHSGRSLLREIFEDESLSQRHKKACVSRILFRLSTRNTNVVVVVLMQLISMLLAIPIPFLQLVDLQSICMNLASNDQNQREKHRIVRPRKVRRMLSTCPKGVEYLKRAVGFQEIETKNGRSVSLQMEKPPNRAEMREHFRDITRSLILVDPNRFMGADFIAVRDNFTWELPGERFQG